MSDAADRLKHRLKTGTLGGDQESRDVEQSIKDACDRDWTNETSNAMLWRNDEIRRLRDALAQKTRECEELRSARNDSEQHFAEEFRKNQALESQVEQLERQVAQWKVEYERVDGTNQALASECTDLRRQVAELSKPVTVQELKKHGCQGLAAVASVVAVNCVIAARAAAER